MAEPTHPLVFDEPTVMWRMQRADGCLSHAVLDARAGSSVVLVWFLNDRPLGYRDFGDCTSALRWSEQMRAQYWSTGWRLAREYDDGPASE